MRALDECVCVRFAFWTLCVPLAVEYVLEYSVCMYARVYVCHVCMYVCHVLYVY